jgi:mRNA-degrading endonuclease YafQ of YafQ-DinJ toxin-antitoxin module
MEQVQFRESALQAESVLKYKELGQKLKDFINFKLNNPLAPFGASDRKFASSGVYNITIPNLRHAHLSTDISIVYKVHGRNPMLIDLYGLFSHEELGTGNPSKSNTQKAMAKRFSQQSFRE